MSMSGSGGSQPRRSTPRAGTRLVAGVLLLACLLTFASCAPPPLPIFGVRTQRGGRPTLHRLDWGYAFVRRPAWSPDGQWIALLAGPDFPSSHPAVVSTDGRRRYDLSSWNCDLPYHFDLVWSPDGQLGCIVANDLIPGTKRLCLGQLPAFQSCHDVRLPQDLGSTGAGSTWSADGQTIWIAANHDLSANEATRDPNLFVVTMSGTFVQMFVFSADEWNLPSIVDGGVYLPQWVPQRQALSYEVGLADIEGPGQLVMSDVTRDAAGQFVLGPRTVLASGQVQDGYAWSPSGHWVAVRLDNGQGNDHIALVNADDPSQIVDVTNERDVGQWLDPVWSPDGKTLILINTDDDQPYAVDIGSYLASKGLQP
ncbi:MAG TPA: hypothetical protein VFU88_05295 [Ktedonobacterales bacterium]|nr:hypothetical protein [Ktedonobacterales bacterium]